MPSKSRSSKTPPSLAILSCVLALFWLTPATTLGQELPSGAEPRFLGVESCASSGCHGGAKEGFNQVILWEKHDYHTRSYATLTTARSRQMAKALQLGEATESARCTTCHAPFHEVPEARRDPSIKILHGVSCENCHGPAEAWLRTHTRADLTHEEKVAAGMRDLRNFYTRANTCAACHQNVEPELLKAGHPELTFELDGQCASEPRHWRERAATSGAPLWLTGQAVALREMSWALGKQPAPAASEVERWKALTWLLAKTAAAAPGPEMRQAFPPQIAESAPPNFAEIQKRADALAKLADKLAPNSESALLRALADTANEFTDGRTATSLHARRAERLVLALDRLAMALPAHGPAAKADKELNALFRAAQSLPDFDPGKFAQLLRAFSEAASR